MQSSLQLLERGPGFLLVQVAGPGGAPTPHDGTVLMQVDLEDGRHDVIAAPVQANGRAELRFDPDAHRGTLHFSGTRGYSSASGVDVDLQP